MTNRERESNCDPAWLHRSGKVTNHVFADVWTQNRAHGKLSMTKSELIARLASRFPQLVVKDADFAVRILLDELVAALERGDRIETRGFGSFEIRRKPPRIARNPRTGEKVEVPAKYVPHFKAGKELRECVNRRG